MHVTMNAEGPSRQASQGLRVATAALFQFHDDNGAVMLSSNLGVADASGNSHADKQISRLNGHPMGAGLPVPIDDRISVAGTAIHIATPPFPPPWPPLASPHAACHPPQPRPPPPPPSSRHSPDKCSSPPPPPSLVLTSCRCFPGPLLTAHRGIFRLYFLHTLWRGVTVCGYRCLVAGLLVTGLLVAGLLVARCSRAHPCAHA